MAFSNAALFMAPPAVVNTPYQSLILSKNPIMYFKLDEAAGSLVAVDSSVNANNGAYGALATLGVAPLVVAGTAMQVTGTGTTTSLIVPHIAAYRLLAQYTVEFWIKTTATTGTIITKANLGGGNNAPFLARLVAGKVRWEIRYFNNVGIDAAIESSNVVNDGLLHHVAIRDNGSALVMLIDSVQVASSSTDSFSVWASGADMPIGIGCAKTTGANTAAMVGIIDEVAIYSGALSDASILQNYQKGVGLT